MIYSYSHVVIVVLTKVQHIQLKQCC